MEQAHDAIAYAVMLCLPLVAWVISQPPVWSRLRPRLEPVALSVWQQLVEQREEPDDVDLRRWAYARLDGLQASLERVRRLVKDDGWMTGTRQVGNRMAYARLVDDVHDAEVTAAAYGPVDAPILVAAAPLAPMSHVFRSTSPGPVVEMIELGPRSRRHQGRRPPA